MMQIIFCQKCREPYYLEELKFIAPSGKQRETISCPYECGNSATINRSLTASRWEVWKIPKQVRDQIKVEKSKVVEALV